jgi:LuxR family maltose regulon positive regulatory protein
MGVLGRVHYEWNQLDSALEIGSQALELSKKWGQANTLLGNHLFMGNIYRIQGKFPQALASIEAAREVGGRISDTHAFVIGTHEAAVHLAMGEIDAVQDWVQQDSVEYDTSTAERWWELAPLLVALYQERRIGSLDPLLEALNNLLDTFESKGAQRQVIKANIQKALILETKKSFQPALDTLNIALTLAETEGYVRSFIDHGRSMKDILKKGFAAGIQPAYCRQLLSEIRAEQDYREIPSQPGSLPKVATLTKRETEVLRLLATDSTIPEIANLLVISTGTLQTHIKRIYRKLGAHSRFEAVTRGKESGLI